MMKQQRSLTKEQYLKKFSRAVRWRLPPQESEEAIADYRELVFQPERDESKLVEELGEPVQAAHLLTDVKAYRRWLAVFAVLAFGVFLVSMVSMVMVVCAYSLFVYSLTFYLTDPNGIMVLSVAAADLLGGAIVPLPFLPEGFRKFAELTPFASMQNVPLRIFSGDIPLSEAPAVMGLQAFWIVILLSAGYLLTRSGLRRAVILGG